MKYYTAAIFNVYNLTPIIPFDKMNRKYRSEFEHRQSINFSLCERKS